MSDSKNICPRCYSYIGEGNIKNNGGNKCSLCSGMYECDDCGELITTPGKCHHCRMADRRKQYEKEKKK